MGGVVKKNKNTKRTAVGKGVYTHVLSDHYSSTTSYTTQSSKHIWHIHINIIIMLTSTCMHMYFHNDMKSSESEWSSPLILSQPQ